MSGSGRLTTARHFTLSIGGAVLLGVMCGVAVIAFVKVAALESGA